jgi:hypothetical protein
MTEPHHGPRVARFLILATDCPDPPGLSRDAVPAGAAVVGDGVGPPGLAAVHAAALAARAACDARPGRWWVWVAHDQFFYVTNWQFYYCVGPPGWVSPRLAASAASQAAAEARRLERKVVERAAGQIRKEAARTRPRGKKMPRNMDAIAEQAGE